MAKCFALLIVFLLQIAAIPPLLAQKDDDVITVDSSIVIANVYVTDAAGKAVSGIDRKYFHIFEDGVEQQIESFGSESTPFAAVILLDTSGSMAERVTLARSAAIQFLDGVRGDDNVAIFNFDSKVKPVQDFSATRYMNERAFDLKADGMTVLNDAVYKAAEVLSQRPEKRRAIIVLSDGADTASKRSEEKALKAALSINAAIYTVDMSAVDSAGLERRQNQAALKNFAEKTGGRFVSTPGGVAMRDAFKRIVEELGNQYTIAYQPGNLKKDGRWRSIEVRISRPALTIRTRKGYNGPKAK